MKNLTPENVDDMVRCAVQGMIAARVNIDWIVCIGSIVTEENRHLQKARSEGKASVLAEFKKLSALVEKL
jgi:hypothetical protein